jgi:hypothetical protein
LTKSWSQPAANQQQQPVVAHAVKKKTSKAKKTV